MVKKKACILLLSTALSAGAISSAKANCLSKTDLLSFQIKQMQTQFMVGALYCIGSKERGHQNFYNTLMTIHSGELLEHQRVLQKYFRQVYGARGTEFYDSFDTSLANTISLAAYSENNFCKKLAISGNYLQQNQPLADMLKDTEMPIQMSLPKEKVCDLSEISVSINSAD